MAWYRTGTISLTNGSTAVTGSGTAWISNAAVGEALLAPDGKLYEIANIASDTSITLGSNYLGATQSGQAYVIVPSQSYIRDLAAQAAALVNNYSTFYNTVGQGKFPDGAVATPAISFSNDTNTGLYRSAADEVTLVANGVAIAKWNTSGFSFVSGVSTITANSASPALKITQTGAGNALVVEDVAGDGSPTVIDQYGNVIIGDSTARLFTVSGTTLPAFQLHSTNGATGSIGAGYWGTDTTGASLAFGRSKSGTVGTHTLVANSDTLGNIRFSGSDGAAFVDAARITAAVDGTPGPNDMPGRLVFSTTPDNSATPTERMRIDSAGNVGIGATPQAGAALHIAKATGATGSHGVYFAATVQPDVTDWRSFSSYTNVSATTNLTALYHYRAQQGTITTGGSVGTQYGYAAENNLNGAANNNGFFSNIGNNGSATITSIERTGNVAKATCSAAPNFLVGSRVYVYVSTAGYADFNGYATVTAVDATSFSYASTGTDVATVAVSGTGYNRRNLSFNATSTAHNFFGGVVRMGSDNFGLANLEAITQLNVSGTSQGTSGITQVRTNADAAGPTHYMCKSRSATAGGHTIVQVNDVLGTLDFRGSDGHNYIQGASIVAASDGTPGTNDMPGRLVFLTTPDGSASAQERLRIDSAGRVIDYAGVAQAPTRSTVASGSTISLTTGTNHLLYDQSATVAALTVTLPSSGLVDGQIITIATRSAITALTVNGGTIYGAPTTLDAGGFASFIYSSGATAWFRKG